MPRRIARLTCFGLGFWLAAVPATAEPAAEAAPAFPVTYQRQGYLGISLGRDGGDPIGLWRSAVADFDGDGRQDVIFTGNARALHQVKRLPVKLFVSNGTTLVDATKRLLPSNPLNQLARDIHVADFNGDGRLDIFFSNHGTEITDPFPGEQNQIFLSTEAGPFVDGTDTWLPAVTDFSHGSSVADFDGDGLPDIFVTNLGDDELNWTTLLLNEGGQRMRKVADFNDRGDYLPDVQGPYWSHPLDIDGDGDVDIYHAELYVGANRKTIRYLENDGSGRFSVSGPRKTVTAFPQNPKHVAQDSRAADVNRDGLPDLILYDNIEDGSVVVQVLINKGNGKLVSEPKRVPRIPKKLTGHPRFEVADLDGDGDPDIFLNNFRPGFDGTDIVMLLNDGKGFYSVAPARFHPQIRPAYAVIDVNDDGLPDFLSDETWSRDWQNDPKNQLLVTLARLDSRVVRKGWRTDDAIAGGSANDQLAGLAGNDILRGNGGNDVLIGGPGADRLFGGPGSDRFVYKTLADSLPGAEDVIEDFNGKQGDRIVMSRIDADRTRAGNQAFGFIGKRRFSGKPGELRFAKGFLEGDVDGDGVPDIRIQVKTTKPLKPGHIVL